MEETFLKIPTATEAHIVWLQKRIKITKEQLYEAVDINLKINIGTKLRAYKDCLNYIIEHQ